MSLQSSRTALRIAYAQTAPADFVQLFLPLITEIGDASQNESRGWIHVRPDGGEYRAPFHFKSEICASDALHTKRRIPPMRRTRWSGEMSTQYGERRAGCKAAILTLA